MKYVRVENKAIAEIFPYNPFTVLVNSKGEMDEDLKKSIRNISNEQAVYGWIEGDNGVFTQPPTPGEAEPADSDYISEGEALNILLGGNV